MTRSRVRKHGAGQRRRFGYAVPRCVECMAPIETTGACAHRDGCLAVFEDEREIEFLYTGDPVDHPTPERSVEP